MLPTALKRCTLVWTKPKMMPVVLVRLCFNLLQFFVLSLSTHACSVPLHFKKIALLEFEC